MNSYSVCDVMETHWPAAWSEQSPRWPTWPGPTGWTPGGAWAMCTSPPWTCTWLARYLTDKDKKKAKKAVLKIKWQLVWLSQQSDQSWSCVYFVTLNECFFTSFFFKTCLQPKHWKIYKPPHKTPLVFLLGTWWFNIWKSFALTNSVYLQRHHTTLIAWCQLITFGIKSAALPKISAAGCPKHERIPSYAGSRRLGAGPIRRTGYIETSWRGAHFTCNALSTTPTW